MEQGRLVISCKLCNGCAATTLRRSRLSKRRRLSPGRSPSTPRRRRAVQLHDDLQEQVTHRSAQAAILEEHTKVEAKQLSNHHTKAEQVAQASASALHTDEEAATAEGAAQDSRCMLLRHVGRDVGMNEEERSRVQSEFQRWSIGSGRLAKSEQLGPFGQDP